MAELRERQISKKLWIRELLDGTPETRDGINTFKTARGEVGRVNVLGVVIDKVELPISSITIDDGSGQLTVRSFDQKLNQRVGEIVQVIGRPRLYQGMMYLATEAVAVVNSGWLAYRKKELGDPVLSVVKHITIEPQTTVPNSDENRAEKILRLIAELDSGDGAPIEIVALKSQIPEAEEIIDKLLLTGDIFELRPGKVKVL